MWRSPPLWLVLAAALALPLFAAVEPLERSGFDLRLGMRPSAGWPKDLVLVPVDEGALEAHGRWPWKRTKVAELLRATRAAGARTVLVDFVFVGATEPEHDAALEGALDGAILAVAGAKEANQQNSDPEFRAKLLPGPAPENVTWDLRTFVMPESRFIRAAAGIGHTIAFPEDDLVLRGHVPLLGMPTEEGVMPSLALAALKHQRGWAAKDVGFDERGNLRLPTGTLALRNGEGHLDWIPGDEARLPRVRAADLLAGTAPPKALDGALALLYVDSLSTPDRSLMPGRGVVPGGISVATAIRTIDGRRVPKVAPTWAVLVAVFGALLLASIPLSSRSPRVLVALAVALPLAFFAFGCALVAAADFFVPVASPAVLLLVSCGALAVRADRLAEGERRHLKKLLAAAQELVPAPAVERSIEERATAVVGSSTNDSTLGRLAAGAPLVEPVEIGHYRVSRCLGRGGMGAIFLAEDTKLDRLVALKVLVEQDPTAFERFRREAQAVAKIDHPNVVRIFEIGADADVPYLALEFVPGGSVIDWFRGYPRHEPWPPPWSKSIGIVRGAAAGLGAAHAAGIVHRDVKPANILLTTDGTAKIADFGIAKLGSSSLTREGSMMGTIGYLAPEQAFGTAVEARSDVYSLGVTWYRLVTARAPFDGTTAEILRRQATQSVPDPRLVVPELPARVAELIMRMTHVDRENRPADGTAVAREIDEILANAETLDSVRAPAPGPAKG